METYDFTDLYRLDNNAGVVITDTADIKSRVEDMMKTVFGADVDVTEETPMGRLVEMITVLMSQTLSINAQNANQFNINLATGVYLDAIGSLFGITPAESSALPLSASKLSLYFFAVSVVWP